MQSLIWDHFSFKIASTASDVSVGLVLVFAYQGFLVLCMYYIYPGFPRLLENPVKSWIFSLNFQDLESPGKSLWSWKVLENILENYVSLKSPASLALNLVS